MFKVPAILTKAATMKDGGAKCVFETNELPPEQLTELFSRSNKYGWLIFVDQSVAEIEIPSDPLPELGEKSLSERLREVEWVYFKKKNGTEVGFRDWHTKRMEERISKIKELIDELK